MAALRINTDENRYRAVTGQILRRCLARISFAVGRYRIFQVNDNGIGTAGRSFGKAFRSIAGDKEDRAHFHTDFHEHLR
jgi:hypothetical protein